MKKVLTVLVIMMVAATAVFAADNNERINLKTTIEVVTGFKIVAPTTGTPDSLAEAKILRDDVSDTDVALSDETAIKKVVVYTNKASGSYKVEIQGGAFQLDNNNNAGSSARFGYKIKTDTREILTVAAEKTADNMSNPEELVTLTGGNGTQIQAFVLKSVLDDTSTKDAGAYTAVLKFTVTTE